MFKWLKKQLSAVVDSATSTTNEVFDAVVDDFENIVTSDKLVTSGIVIAGLAFATVVLPLPLAVFGALRLAGAATANGNVRDINRVVRAARNVAAKVAQDSTEAKAEPKAKKASKPKKAPKARKAKIVRFDEAV